ncbi:tRNA (adenosine(37)-N6)-threonylcarbamoyltransferase complex dimerization subunit type 1 TsaB [Sporosarcina sp. USHLN248]|uniref:tRNA (adenosine(37)-N6)-threonylcarbamoyltransferase complex dimerization subunit type 1 TsaB n=1 Tax=Sporosarcina sp. USHLN248 TaxID=3081300 RepID=UPI00301894C9
MIWLGIDTANTPLSIAIVKDGKLLSEVNTSVAVNHSLQAMPEIEDLFKRVKLEPDEIDAIAVSEGPGSYTGVRIGVTIAKTLAWTLKKPLVGVSSLQVLCANGLYFNGVLCPVVDARRGNVYSAIYEYKDGQLLSLLDDGHYSMNDVLQAVVDLKRPVLFIGKDVGLHEQAIVEKCENVTIAPYTDQLPRASKLIAIAEKVDPESSVHAFTPEYRRIAEAEANWLKQQRKEQDSE